METALFLALSICSLGTGYYLTALWSQRNSANGDTAQSILDASTAVIWKERRGQVTKANASHKVISGIFGRTVQFCDFVLENQEGSPTGSKLGGLTLPDRDEILRFELCRKEVKGDIVYTAFPADRIDHIEEERQRFIQILGETFAQLPVGIAVFDKNRDLSLFNPALVEFLDCQTSWLAKRPSLRTFLDRLHDAGLLPEPKDYRDWRDRLVEMEQSAAAGTYHEDWYLPNSRVLRVTGRPHPKGSVAFVFEDITRSVAVERDYRMELERFHAVFDGLEPALVVFDHVGKMVFSNRAFDDLWQVNFAETIETTHLHDVTKLWQEKCQPNPIFGEIRDFTSWTSDGTGWDGYIRLLTGEKLHVQISPLPDNSIAVEFLPLARADDDVGQKKESA